MIIGGEAVSCVAVGIETVNCLPVDGETVDDTLDGSSLAAGGESVSRVAVAANEFDGSKTADLDDDMTFGDDAMA